MNLKQPQAEKNKHMSTQFEKRWTTLEKAHEELLHRKNTRQENSNGIYDRYNNPVLTARHTPLFWRYDLNPETNPHLMERFGINAVFNSGAIKFMGKYIIVGRVEGWDRKSFFAVAESENGVDNFRFWDYPINMP